jgi:hypothetical protein
VAAVEGPLAGPIRCALLQRNGVLQMLEVFVPERPTYQPNTAGWPAEAAAGLVALPSPGEGSSAANRATAAAAALALDRPRAAAHAAAPAAVAAAAAAGADGAQPGSATLRRHHTAADFRRAYASGTVTPVQVAENIIAAVAASEAQVGR